MAGLQFTAMVIGMGNTSTAKTNVGIQTPANQMAKILGIYAGFDGVDATKAPALVEVCTCTFASNGPGSGGSSTFTPATTNGYAATVQCVCGSGWTSEPTVITSCEPILVPTFMGNAVIFYPLLAPMVILNATGCVLRITLPSGVTVNFTGGLKCEE